MTQPPEQEQDHPPQSTTRVPPPRRSCGSRILGFLGWILTLALSVALAIVALGAIAYFYFGLNLATPQQIRQASDDVATLRADAAALQTEVALLATAEAEGGGALAAARGELDDLSQRLGELEAQADALVAEADALSNQAGTAVALSGDLEEAIALASTIQAEGRENQVLVAVVATIQAQNSSTLADLQARTDRLSRFLQRLSDLADDSSAADGATPTPTPTAGDAEEPTATP